MPVKPVLDLIGERESTFVGKAWIPVSTGMTAGALAGVSARLGLDVMSDLYINV